MARAAIFDFYGTLARAVRWGPSVADVFAGLGHRLDEEAYEAWRGEVFDGMEHLAQSESRDLYLAWERARLRRLGTASGVGPEDVEELAAELHRAMQDFRLAAYDEVPEVLAELRRRGLVVAVCSNWTWDLDVALKQCALSGAADVVVTSAQAGVRKPHPRIFSLTLERCGVAPAEAVFVGDTWYPDVEGALAAGLRPVHVWRPEEAVGAEPPPLPAGVQRVSDLSGVLELV
ncbi:MAG TPA: HAD family hydrolase [Acidimicrobiales bacterium]|nr:HAD family hydrolase [Acidimicrobiales bacterium]